MGLLAASLLFAVVLGLALYFGGKVKEASVDSVAVLPFVNATGNPDAEYLSEGITQGLINTPFAVAKIKGCLPDVGLSLQREGHRPTLRRPAIWEFTRFSPGAWFRQGVTISISAELIDAEHDSPNLVENQYQRKLTDVTSLEPDITRDITENLKLKLSGAPTESRRSASHAELRSLSIVFAGEIHWNRRTSGGLKQSN